MAALVHPPYPGTMVHCFELFYLVIIYNIIGTNSYNNT